MKRLTALMVCLVLAAGAVVAQGSKSEEAKLRLGVVVVDEHGAPIRGLTASDFTIESAGKPETPELRNLKATEATATAAGEFTNRNHAVMGRGLVVLVLDTMHTRWADEKNLRPLIANYLGALAKRNTPVSLLIMDQSGVLHSVHDFTTSAATLAAALERADAVVHKRAPAGEASPEVAAETQRLADFLKGAIANQTPTTAPLRASPEYALEMFRSVAEATASILGRKSLVWITNTTPFEVEDKTRLMMSLSVMAGGGYSAGGPPSFGSGNLNQGLASSRDISVEHRDSLSADDIKRSRPLWKAAFAALQHADVALIPVAARGTGDSGFNPQTLHAMRSVAEMTGGREIHVVGDPFPQMADLPDQNLEAYDLTAALPQGCKSDWCDLKLTVKRPGAKVMAPAGFFRAVVPKSEEVFAAALGSPLDFVTLPFVVRWGQAEPGATGKKVSFVVMFPPEAEVPPVGSSALNLEIVARAIATAGTTSQTMNFNAAGELPQASVDQIRQHGFTLNNAIELPPGEYVVRFFVRDKTSGRVGSVTAPLKVS